MSMHQKNVNRLLSAITALKNANKKLDAIDDEDLLVYIDNVGYVQHKLEETLDHLKMDCLSCRCHDITGEED